MLKKTTILVAPLDWGIGHATRIIPIVHYLTNQNFEIIIAADEDIKTLLAQEFPKIKIIFLQGYNIKYSKSKYWMPIKIVRQIPAILISITKEHSWLKKVVKEYNINGIISDNRFGLFHSGTPSAFISHQLSIKTGNRFLECQLQKMHNWFINKYTVCWVPDYKEIPNIAGELSHPKNNLPNNVEYIGALSRFNKISETIIIYKLLILLSGPEPQRSILENLLLEQVRNFEGKVLFVRGLPLQTANRLNKNVNKNVEIKNYLSAHDLNIAIAKADLVICRSGYSSIMDLIKMQKRAILIATPGQTEQVYLAHHLMQQNLFYAVEQKGFNLKAVLENVAKYNFSYLHFNMEQYKNAVIKFALKL